MTAGYALLVWDDPAPPASIRAHRLERAMTSDRQWRVLHRQPGVTLFVEAGAAVTVRAITGGRGLVIGEVFDQRGDPAAMDLALPPASAHGLGSTLNERFWGRYVALFTTPAGRPEAVFRDPSGALEARILGGDGLWVVGSSTPDIFLTIPRQIPTIRWDAFAEQLADPSLTSCRSALTGVDVVAPGAWVALRNPDQPCQLWRPSRFAREAIDDIDVARAGVRQVLDRTVAALSRGRTIVAEVSGGLDSALVAAALAAASANVRRWICFTSEGAASDERRYARAVADHLGFDLTIIPKAHSVTRPEDLAAVQTAFEPSINALDLEYDLAMARQVVTQGADAIFTGFGGDAVYFQMADPAIIEDRVLRLGRRGLTLDYVGDLARWTRRPALGLIRRGLRAGQRFQGYPKTHASWLPAPSAVEHPWCEGADDLPPAKRLHLASLCQMLTGYGCSRRGTKATVIHPHLTQPVMEQCLRTPVDLLTTGPRDRGLVREAYAGRLPPAVLHRRSKGDLGVHYAHAFAAALPDIRAYLLDGLLVGRGVVRRAELEAALDESVLAQAGGALELLHAVAVEAWARHWTTRLARVRSDQEAGA